MDFALSDIEKEIAALAAKVFASDDCAAIEKSGLLDSLEHGVGAWCAMLAAAGAAATRAPIWACTVARAAGAPKHGLATIAFHHDGAAFTAVPAAARADWFVLVKEGRMSLAGKADVTVEPQVATGGEAVGRVTVREAKDLGPSASTEELAAVGLCALELGLCETVLRMTAKYTSERVQFERPIATFQAVAQRAADAYIDVETIRLSLAEAAYRLDAKLPAARAVAIAKLTAADAGQRVTYAAQHLHGGIGFDLDYPLAKYYPLAKWLELQLGGASEWTARLGADLARDERYSE